MVEDSASASFRTTSDLPAPESKRFPKWLHLANSAPFSHCSFLGVVFSMKTQHGSGPIYRNEFKTNRVSTIESYTLKKDSLKLLRNERKKRLRS